jgi:hypothetical protein
MKPGGQITVPNETALCGRTHFAAIIADSSSPLFTLGANLP